MMKKGREFMMFHLLIISVVLSTLATPTLAANVTYDSRALLIDGSRKILISGSIHYPRSTPEMWPDLIQKSKEGGLDMIETYVFWSLHEPVQNQYNFEGRNDLVQFVKLVAKAGLYVHLRIGPYVCAEWNYGGFPLWLHFIPGIKFRTDNEPFKREMQRFTEKIVDLMKEEKLYASQGGPIILSQIENEYGNIDNAYGSAAKSYINWAATMATSLDTGVPWVMCQQADAPDPIINTCNGFYCDQFTPNSNKKPKMWTENWSGWFQSFGGAMPYRPAEDLAFAVARFFQRGGTLQNYYMYHGGTNFGRTTGGPFIVTSYDYDAPLDEFGQLRQPKYGHLTDVHKAIKLCERALLGADPSATFPGTNLEVTVYKSGSGLCAAFLANFDAKSDATVKFNGDSYFLPAWSVSILPDCKNVVLNTAKINSATVSSRFARQPLRSSEWSWVDEPVGISKKDVFTRRGLLEQINTTADQSDYLWYSTSTDIQGDELDGLQTVLHVESLGHVFRAFINGKFIGGKSGRSGNIKVSADLPVTLNPGKNKIDLLSVTVGLQNYGAFFELSGAGITGPVQLKGLKNGTTIDLSSQQWTYQIGLNGEDSGLPGGSSSQWVSGSDFPKNQPLRWYKFQCFLNKVTEGSRGNKIQIMFTDQTKFDAPTGSDPVALDMTGMGKGETWVNGQSIGRYWPSNVASNEGCSQQCNYRGSYSATKCLKNCGKPSQQLYHVPRSWLEASDNTLVLFEEIGGDPTLISIATKQTESLCLRVSESHPMPVDMWSSLSRLGPVLSLHCPSPDQIISSIKFASFGTPHGTCGSFNHGKCSTTEAHSIVEKACIGSRSCNVGVSTDTFGDPCVGVTKSLAVEALCA